MIIVGVAAARRRMRQHQDISPRRPRLPLWRLLLGEVGWALGQLVRAPQLLAALLLGIIGTLAVLDAAAPGPVLPWPGRAVVALLVGLALSRGLGAWLERREDGEEFGHAPSEAVTEFVGVLTGFVLLGWLATWLVTLVG